MKSWHDLSIRQKLVGSTISCIAVITGTALLTAYLIISKTENELASKQSHMNTDFIQSQINAMRGQVAAVAALAAQRPDVVEAIRNRNSDYLRKVGNEIIQKEGANLFVTFVDKQGVVIARNYSEKAGDTLRAIAVEKALKGEGSVGIDEGSLIKVSLRAGAPIWAGKEVIGAVNTGFNLLEENKFVDEIKRRTNVECTIFHGDTRLTTTLMKDGNRAVGTKMDNPEVLDRVLKRGEQFHTVISLMGTRYDAEYSPLKAMDGRIIGMLFNGTPRAQIEKTSRQVLWYIVLSVGLVGILMIGASFYVSTSMTRPLKRTMDTVGMISKGDLTARIDVASGDEIGEMGRHINGLVETLHDAIVKVASSSTQVSEEAALLEAGAQGMKGGAEQVATQVDLVATASEEMSVNSSEIAQKCTRVAKSSQDANTSAIGGEAIIGETMAVMNRIQVRAKNSAEIIENLGKRSSKIGQVIDLINDIADQTNLLALNAAIEAARAGEHGRGFAVVADEVKKLAERTGKATREISLTIKEMEEGTKDAVGSMEEGVNEVEEGVQRAAESGDTLKDILRQVETVSLEIGQIAVASEQQTASTDEIAQTIQKISGVMGATSEQIRDNSRAAAHLAALSKELHMLVAQFRV